MKFEELKLKGAFLIHLEPRCDERGFFARAWCEKEFSEAGLDTCTKQCNIAYNVQKGILRGMHFQREPHAETKIVRCIRGRILDVIIDLRKGSPTRTKWLGVELNEDNRLALYVPKGFAHGYLTLTDKAEIFYQVSESYHPESEGGVRWNDKAFGIEWPFSEPLVSPKDSSFPDFKEEAI